MKKLTKIIACISAVVLLASAFAGCEGNNVQTRRKSDGKSFTYWVNLDGSTQNAGLTNNNEMFLYQEMEKRTGVHIDFIHPATGTTGEAATTMFLDEVLPDIIKYSWDQYPGGPAQAIEDGVIIALDEHLDIKTVAPGYWAYVGKDNPENDARRKSVTTSDGRYYGFNRLDLGETKGFSGMFTRKDKLEEWGMDVPETLDDWEALFAKAKAEGFEKPLTCGLNYISFTPNNGYGFYLAFGAASGFYLDDANGETEVVFAPNHPKYTEYVSHMRDWYAKGYIDPDFATIATDLVNSNMVNDVSIASIGYIGGGMGEILPAAKNRNPNYDLVACPFPKNIYDGSESEFQQYTAEGTPIANAITYQCGNYEAAAKWCDYVYTEEGMILQLFGQEGVHHNVEYFDYDGDGEDEKHYVYTDLITTPKNSGCNTVSEAMYKYMLPCNYPGYCQHIDYLLGYYQEEAQKEALSVWNAPNRKEDGEGIDTPAEHTFPTLDYTVEESIEIKELKTLCQAPLEATLVDVIMGKKTIKDWEAALKTANKNGYTRLLEIYNDCYDRYLEKE